MTSGGIKLLIAGGKTGGHLFPGIAVAHCFLQRGAEREVMFVGTKDGIESRVLPKEGLALATVRSAGLRGKGAGAILRGLVLIPVALLESVGILRSFRPDVAFGVGGFVSGPALLAAKLMGVPFAILEQNVTPGVTNRVLARIAKKVFVSFEESLDYFSSKKAVVSGNPVRNEVVSPAAGEPELKLDKFDSDKTLLVFGGSQGAVAVNRAVVDFFRSHPTIRDHTNLIHQTGRRDLSEVREAYREMGYERTIVTPFIYRMGEAYQAADLVICRAGAGTVFELAALGKPSILVPFPHAVDDHQAFNAAALAGRGAAVMIRQEEIEKGALSRALKELLTNSEKLEAMAGKAAGFAKPDAADVICDGLEEMTGNKGFKSLA